MKLGNLESLLPGLRTARTYRREWLPSDLVAGLSVAAVALPIGIAYSQLAGFPPVVGIYSCILPPVAYAFFGSSRQLVVNPDSAACAIIASTVAPLAAGDATRYQDLSITLAFLTGVLCIVGGITGLGAIANFLSRPILIGYLNGIALSIIVGQLPAMLGFKVPPAGFFRMLAAIASRLGETHFATFGVGLFMFFLLRVFRRLFPKAPAPLLAAIVGIGAVYFLGLNQQGVAIVGPVPKGLPTPRIPSIATAELLPLTLDACGIVLVSFCSMMTTARGFAAKNGYTINVNQDMIALGVSDLASGVSRGFVVSGADSRTAVADSAGGKTQVASVVAAVTMAAVLFFLTAPLAYLPTAALAAILISSALGLFDVKSLRDHYRISKAEFRQSMVAMLGVMTIGVLPGILVAVGLAILSLLLHASHPHDAILGEYRDAFADIKEGATPVPGIIIYRFDSALLFFNADHFRDRTEEIIRTSMVKPQWFLLDAESIPLLDITGAAALSALHNELAKKGIILAIARSKGMFRIMLERTGVADTIGSEFLFSRVQTGVEAFRAGNTRPT